VLIWKCVNPAHANLKITPWRERDFQIAGSSLHFDVLIDAKFAKLLKFGKLLF
jgi:hypothetical protein